MAVNFGKNKAKAELLKHLPTGPLWFSEGELKTGQVGKLVNALAENIGLFLEEANRVRNNLFLNLADATGLERWGSDLLLERRPGESDEAYRARLSSELLRLRVTRPAVQSYVEDVSGLSTTIFLPWKFQDWRDQRTIGLPLDAVDPFYGRSGQARRTSTYYQGGVIDVVTEGYSPNVSRSIYEIVAAGIQVYFTANVDGNIITIAPEEMLVYEKAEIDYDIIVDKLYPVFIRSVSGLRSGHPLITLMNDIWYGLLADLAHDGDNVDNHAEVFLFDLFPPIRSVYSFERSPRSGAPGATFFVEDPYIFGEIEIGADPTTEYVNHIIEYTALSYNDFGSRYSLDKKRSGFSDPFVFVVLDLDNLPFNGKQRIWDEPSWDGPYTIYDTALTWESLEEYTWDEALAGHSAQVTADVLLEA